MSCLLSIFLVFIACVSGQTDPVVKTSDGQIIGLEDEINKFLGIPYAVVDVKKPFGRAIPHSGFKTPYYANRDPVICPQIVKGVPQGNIQCLNLNVYTPKSINQNKSLPVMVFIHGGGYKEGDGNFNTYSPTFLVKKDVIVVTINYRLGPYGFLCLEHDEYSNQGIKDQSLALKWVKKNIKAFGGDKNNILLFGHSAGSGCAEFHLLFNKDKVFKKVILQSLQLVSPLMTLKPADNEYLIDMAAKVGIDSKQMNVVDIVEELSNISIDLLVNITFNDKFRPCIDSFTIGDEFINHNLNDMKIMIGNTAQEVIFFYKDEVNYDNIIKKELTKEFNTIRRDGITRAENYYLIGNVTDDVIDFGCDFLFNYPVDRSVRHYLRNNATVYRYIFSYDGRRNFVKVRDSIDTEGAGHGDELGYLFDPDIFGNVITADDLHVINTMTTFWTNFAKYGDPTPLELSLRFSWPEFSESLSYMNIGRFTLVEQEYRKDQILFWRSFYEDFGVHSRGLHYVEETEFTLKTNTVTRITAIPSFVVGAIIFIKFLF